MDQLAAVHCVISRWNTAVDLCEITQRELYQKGLCRSATPELFANSLRTIWRMERKETGCMARNNRIQKFVPEATASFKRSVAIL